MFRFASSLVIAILFCFAWTSVMTQNSTNLVSGSRGIIFDVKPNGDLLWYKYQGNGESDRGGHGLES
jgi:hypothetical protein